MFTNGINIFSYNFHKIAKTYFAYLRSQAGIACIGYVDGSLYLAHTYKECYSNTLTAVKLFTSLGFRINPKKSMTTPTQTIEYLCFVLSSINMTVKLTDKKIEKYIALCCQFISSRKRHTIRDVASLIGKLTSTFPGVQYGSLHYRSIERDKLNALKATMGLTRQKWCCPFKVF